MKKLLTLLSISGLTVTSAGFLSTVVSCGGGWTSSSSVDIKQYFEEFKDKNEEELNEEKNSLSSEAVELGIQLASLLEKDPELKSKYITLYKEYTLFISNIKSIEILEQSFDKIAEFGNKIDELVGSEIANNQIKFDVIQIIIKNKA